MHWLRIYCQAGNALKEDWHLVHVERTRQDQIQMFHNCSNLNISLQHTPNVCITVNDLKWNANNLQLFKEVVQGKK